jgi:hypothetical protein
MRKGKIKKEQKKNLVELVNAKSGKGSEGGSEETREGGFVGCSFEGRFVGS